jgi:predicted RNase H-like nuclease
MTAAVGVAPSETCYQAFVASVLGIDAAWTERNPSGVALITGAPGRWRYVAVAPSYASFVALADGRQVCWDAPKFEGGVPNAAELLGAAGKLGKAGVDIVAVDMPLATVPIVGWRSADSAISREFGRYGCGTHTPSVTRPGPLSDRFRAEFEGMGFCLATQLSDLGRPRRLIEVYPHVALLKLLSAPYRLKYKVSKVRTYWPTAPADQRIDKLRGLLSSSACNAGGKHG